MVLTVVKTTALSGTITNAQLAGSIDLTAKVTGALPVANGGTALTSGTTGQVLKFTGTTTLASSAGLQSKGGYFSVADLSALSTSDTQAITGVGFQPIAVCITCLVNGAKPFSVGFNAASNSGQPATYDQNSLTYYNSGTELKTYNRDYSFALWTGASDIVRGKITTFASDGFTVTYTVQNSPSSVAAEFQYMALG